MKINILRNTIAWFGKYSGYEGLTGYFPGSMKQTIVSPNEQIFSKIIGKIFQIYKGWNTMKPSEIFAGLRFLSKIGSNDISHILYLERHLNTVSILKQHQNKLFGTIHLPIRQWSKQELAVLDNIGNVIILYKEEVQEFCKYIDRSRIHVIMHGVNVDFFKPGQNASVRKNKVLFVGHYLRNFDMFTEVYEIIKNDIGDLFDYHFIIPSYHRNTTVIQQIAVLKNVFFHEGLSDEELLEFYQTSYLLLMPMQDSGANTAIVQAISCGLPIVTTDVGGIRSYGGGEIFPVVENKASKAMAELFKKYYYDEDFRNSVSENLRRFAIDQLDWNLIATQHRNVYETVLRNKK